MEELYHKTITYCDNFIKENAFLSVIVFGMLTNLLTDAVKKAFAKAATSSIIISKFLSKRLILRGIKGYELQLEEISAYRRNPLQKTGEYLSHLYENFVLFMFIVIACYLITKFSKNQNYIFSFYGASANIFFRIIFGTTVYANTFDNLLNRIDKYEQNTELALKRLNKLI